MMDILLRVSSLRARKAKAKAKEEVEVEERRTKVTLREGTTKW